MVGNAVEAARTSLPVLLQLRDSYDAEGLLERSLEAFLQEAGLAASLDVLYFCLRELADNAIRANAKRAYFAERKLSLTSAADYELGMRDFHTAYSERNAELNRRASAAGLKVAAVLRLDGGLFTCSIRNNSAVAEKEAERVAERLRRAQSFTGLEGPQAVLDATEGAGLGLILVSQVLKKLGLSYSAFSFGPEGGETVASLVIPAAAPLLAYGEELSARLVRFINDLPTMPDKVAALMEALADDRVNMSAIAERITSDPPLTAYILKVANSAAYQLVRKVASIREAVTIIGTTGLSNIILQYGVSVIMGRLPASASEMWRRSSQVAYFARVLAQRRHASQTLVDDTLVGSVLHDIGMIVQYAVDPKLIKRIEALCKKRGAPTRLLEDVLAGLNHARIGGLLARKWNFPEALIQIIEFHHRPWAAASEHRRATGLVYLADCLFEAGEGRVKYAQVDQDILREHGMRDAAAFEGLRSEIAAAYARDSR